MKARASFIRNLVLNKSEQSVMFVGQIYDDEILVPFCEQCPTALQSKFSFGWPFNHTNTILFCRCPQSNVKLVQIFQSGTHGKTNVRLFIHPTKLEKTPRLIEKCSLANFCCARLLTLFALKQSPHWIFAHSFDHNFRNHISLVVCVFILLLLKLANCKIFIIKFHRERSRFFEALLSWSCP